ncbi:hypothetical protein [Bradyrhizobium sp. CCBAU 051011]|uniref:hypothetical protein n=1 Tax=Bradyrhizobium sp. CCBAU 051011 TaxID=858422 RepID=UPI001379F0D4|nr:hypothetical protein [Bradyrhizobium sp. CCBAU 051011]
MSSADPVIIRTAQAHRCTADGSACYVSSGTPWSPLEVLDVYEDFHHLLYPNTGSGACQAKRVTSDERLKKIYGVSRDA